MLPNKINEGDRAGAGRDDQSPARLMRRIKKLEHELVLARRFACYDPLTGLPNRALLMDRLEQATAQAARQCKHVGVLLIDLDDFKSVNDNLGHRAGDTVLKRVAARLLGCVRACDTACRYGGDEFVILLPEIEGAEALRRVKGKIHAQLLLPHQLGKREFVLGGSIGCALFRRDAGSCVSLIDIADAAMYRAKRAAAHAAGRFGSRRSVSFLTTS